MRFAAATKTERCEIISLGRREDQREREREKVCGERRSTRTAEAVGEGKRLKLHGRDLILQLPGDRSVIGSADQRRSDVAQAPALSPDQLVQRLSPLRLRAPFSLGPGDRWAIATNFSSRVTRWAVTPLRDGLKRQDRLLVVPQRRAVATPRRPSWRRKIQAAVHRVQ